ncbi:GNAT family N-acetyltransferase [Flavobacteriaceae bacterium R38]|nr:GNAT family N-acetyltransferase [Flavobacteriaceae bacterium R38]
MTIKRTNANDKDFKLLVDQLDTYLSGINGENDDFFRQFNTIEVLQHVIVFYDKSGNVQACGAFKAYNEATVEIKRMYVLPECRGIGLGSSVLNALEQWAKELGYSRTILETSIKMQDAVQLYLKNKYEEIPKYDPYKNVATSICFEKILNTD